MNSKGFGPYRNEFQREESDFHVTEEVRRIFDLTGFILIRGLMDKEEMVQIQKSLDAYKDVIAKHSYQVSDGHGSGPRMVLWSHPGNDVLGMIPRSKKVASTSEMLMGGDEMYHFHSKLTMKEAKSGGVFEWHQDYGYWYINGNLTDEMNSFFLALDPCTKDSGCLQVLVGSHKAGRIDHNFSGGQQGADPERLEYLKQIYDCHHVELQPGDALFTHSNLLHASSRNNSDHKRWALICAFNKRKNNPVKRHHCPFYTPLSKVPNSAIKDCTIYCDPEGKNFLNPSTDETVHENLYEENKK